MPIAQLAGTELFLSRQGGAFVPTILVDIQTLDGTQYFWSDYEGRYPTKFTGATQFYNGWIKSGCKFTCTKDMSSNEGDLLLQNISGNTIDRDVAAALKNHEFEGAYAVTRLWITLLDAAIREFHCSLTEQNTKEDEVGFREPQLFDPTQYVIAGDVQAETCTFRFKSAQCGSTGTAVSCPKRLVDCQDATRLAQERYPGILTTMPNTVNVPPLAGLGQKPPRPAPGGGRRPLAF